MVLIPLIALWVAIIDFSFGIFLRGTFQHAAREGARYAVTSRTEAGMGHDASIKAAVQRNAMGFLNGEQGASRIHIRYYTPGTLAETQSNAGGNIVEVSIEGYTWNWIAPVLRRTMAPLSIAGAVFRPHGGLCRRVCRPRDRSGKGSTWTNAFVAVAVNGGMS